MWFQCKLRIDEGYILQNGVHIKAIGKNIAILRLQDEIDLYGIFVIGFGKMLDGLGLANLSCAPDNQGQGIRRFFPFNQNTINFPL